MENDIQLGCLRVIKKVDLDAYVGPISEIPDVSFTVNVSGPSYPSGHLLTFNLTDGVITNSPQDLSNLIPGDYYVTESPPAGWSLDSIATSPATVNAGGACGAVTVTVENDIQLGCLRVIKKVDLDAYVGALADIPDVSFTVNVSGPSYPSGHLLTFNLTNGVISPPQDLSNLIPGSYNVTETPPAGWSLDRIVTSPTIVGAGAACGDVIVTVTNDIQLGCLRVIKKVDLDEVTENANLLPNVDFTVNVSGPSYPSGHLLTFSLVGGHIESFPQDLRNLIPGEYTVTETTIPKGWELIGYDPTDQTADVDPGDACGAVNVTVTNRPVADLEVTKSGKINYTVGVKNLGNGTAINVDIDDDLPGALDWKIVPTKSGCAINATTRHLHCDIPSLDAQESFSVRVEALIEASCALPLLGNDATADSDIYDPKTSNNLDDADICKP